MNDINGDEDFGDIFDLSTVSFATETAVKVHSFETKILSSEIEKTLLKNYPDGPKLLEEVSEVAYSKEMDDNSKKSLSQKKSETNKNDQENLEFLIDYAFDDKNLQEKSFLNSKATLATSNSIQVVLTPKPASNQTQDNLDEGSDKNHFVYFKIFLHYLSKLLNSNTVIVVSIFFFDLSEMKITAQ